MYEASRPILSFAIGFIFPIENLLETRVRYGRTMGAKTGRSSGGIRTYTCTRACVYTR